MRTVLSVFGTRPEAIKMAPVVRALRARSDVLRSVVAVTGQHRDMLDQVLAVFDLRPDIDLDLMAPGQRPTDVIARVLERMPGVLAETGADVVLVQGDTTSALAAGLAAFHEQVELGHVEAGLRSGRMDAPFPEEMNRVVLDRIASFLFPPTPLAAEALRREGCPPARMLTTGNTTIDALLTVRAALPGLDLPVRDRFDDVERLVLVTVHRRESHGAPLASICTAVNQLAAAHTDTSFVLPVHPNPKVREPIRRLLKGPRITLIDPLPYPEFVWLLDRAVLVLSDSGGVQEEAPALGCPVLVLREVTERQEVIEAGAGELLGVDTDRIVRAATRLLTDEAARQEMGRPRMLFGDGRAGARIAKRLAGDEVAPWSPPQG